MPFIKIFCFNDFAENTLVIEDRGECIIIDPGCYQQEEVETLIQFIEGHNLRARSIINTHCHIDHVLGVDKIKKHFQIPFLIGEKDLPTLKSVKLYASIYGYSGFTEPSPDDFLQEKQSIQVGEQSWEILDVPGHSLGHIALYNRNEAVCIAGDVLFHRSIGRTDLPGGDHETLIRSIREKLFTLPVSTRVYPGHGPDTTVGEEIKFNPFCGDNVL